MAHAGTDVYGFAAEARRIHTGEIEIRCGTVYVRMEASEAKRLAADLEAALAEDGETEAAA